MLSEAEAMNFRISVESDDPQRNYFVGITTRADFDRLKTAQAVAETLVELEKGYGTIDWTTPDDQLIYRGNKTIDAGRIWSLKPKSDYAVVVFGVGAEVQLRPTFFMISSPRLPSCPPKTDSPSALPPNPPTSR